MVLQIGAGDPVYQGANDGYPLWLNGIYQFPNWTNGGSPSVGTATGKPFVIGASTPIPTEEFIDDIDFINVYDRPLGAAEIVAFHKYPYRLWGV